MDMSSFLTKKRTKEGFFEKISNEPKGTIINKEVAIRNFEKFISEKFRNKSLENIIEELLVLKKNDVFEYEQALYDALQEWINWNTKEGTKSSTLRTFFSNLRSYLYYRGIKTDQQDVKENLKFGKKISDEKHPLSQEEYRAIVNAYDRHPKRQALYLTLGSSGMRIGEAVRLRKKDFDFSQKRVKINIPAEITKTRKGRVTYISKEAEMRLKPILEKIESENFVFSFGKDTTDRFHAAAHESKMLTIVLRRLGMDSRYSSNKFRKITSHSFRAYFFTNACRVHGENYAHRLVGHGGYLTQYDRMTEEEKMEMYLGLESHLMIFDQTKNEIVIERLREENQDLKEMKKEIQSLRDEIARKNQILEI